MGDTKLADLAKGFVQLKKDVSAAANLLVDIGRLDSNRIENLAQLRAKIVKVRGVLTRLEDAASWVRNAESLIDQYRELLSSTEQQLGNRFGADLDQDLKVLGLSVRGQFPELRAGVFTFELDPTKGKVTIWYGPKQERLAETKFSPSTVARTVERLRNSLGSGMAPEQFLKVLRKACARTGVRAGEGVPIGQLLYELVHLLQDTRFKNNPRKEYFRGYGRADFSFDLYRLSGTKEIHLRVATRAYTRRQRDFLWIPNSENGEGTVYSHLELKGEP